MATVPPAPSEKSLHGLHVWKYPVCLPVKGSVPKGAGGDGAASTQRQLAVYKKIRATAHARRERGDLFFQFFWTKITSTTNASASCCGSKDAYASTEVRSKSNCLSRCCLPFS